MMRDILRAFHFRTGELHSQILKHKKGRDFPPLLSFSSVLYVLYLHIIRVLAALYVDFWKSGLVSLYDW